MIKVKISGSQIQRMIDCAIETLMDIARDKKADVSSREKALEAVNRMYDIAGIQ